MHQLCYYAPDYREAVHETILALLEQVKSAHGIPYEIIQLRHIKNPYSYDLITDRGHEKEIYERDFLPRKGVLKFRTGQQLPRLLRSQSGNYFIGGTVAIAVRGRVEWLAHHGSPFASYDPEPAVAFLRAVLKRGPSLFYELCVPVTKASPEQELLGAFVKSGLLEGTISQEVKVGNQVLTADGARFDWRKSIDLLIENNADTWILEVKTELTYEALGEVMTYASLYRAQSPTKRIRKGIVCGGIDREILETCHEQDITVFEINGDEIRVHKPLPAGVRSHEQQHTHSVDEEAV